MPPSKVPPTANVIAKDFQVTGFNEREIGHTESARWFNRTKEILHHKENVSKYLIVCSLVDFRGRRFIYICDVNVCNVSETSVKSCFYIQEELQ